jgi:cell division transport system permease protein
MRPRQPNKNPSHYLKNYFLRHVQAALSSIGQFSRSPLSALMTCVIIGIALALPTALFLLLKNVTVLNQNFVQTTQMTVYLKQNVNEAQAITLARTLKKNPAFSKITLISPQQGLSELQQQAGINNILADLQNNPIPWAIVVVPNQSVNSPTALTDLNHAIKQNPEVDTVQLDMLWVERLFTLLTIANRATYALAIFLGIAVLLIVNNCIRSATSANKKEINVIKLIGGSDSFIRRPFLYAGGIYGLLGGIMAWLLVDCLLLWLNSPVNQLASLYHSSFHLLGISILDTFLLLISSIALSLLGSWLAVTRFLRRSRA